jgi:hypothetical protein
VSKSAERTPEKFFAGSPRGLAIYAAVSEALQALGAVTTVVGKSQVAFRHRKGFAYLWRPGQYIRSDVPAVLSIALPHPIESARFKSVVHPAATTWMHHLELRDECEIDAQVREWLAEAYASAS